MNKTPPNDLESIGEYLSSPLEPPEIDPNSVYKPYHSIIDDQIEEILSRYKPQSGSLGLPAFTLLDSTVITPPKEDDFKLAYYQEVIEYGDYFDVYAHTQPKIFHKQPRPKSVGGYREPNVLDEIIKEARSSAYRKRNSVRALNRIRQLTLSNFTDDNVKLLTLTFGDCDFDITNPRICNKKFSVLMGKLRKRYPDFKYLGVIEFQKRGAVHYHILCDLPYIEKEYLADLWGHGFIDIRKPDYVIGSYLFKYLTKEMYIEKLKGVRVYFYSNNLTKPKLHTGVRAYNLLQTLKDKQIYFANSYRNKYNHDIVKYRQFKVSPAPS